MSSGVGIFWDWCRSAVPVTFDFEEWLGGLLSGWPVSGLRETSLACSPQGWKWAWVWLRTLLIELRCLVAQMGGSCIVASSHQGLDLASWRSAGKMALALGAAEKAGPSGESIYLFLLQPVATWTLSPPTHPNPVQNSPPLQHRRPPPKPYF